MSAILDTAEAFARVVSMRKAIMQEGFTEVSFTNTVFATKKTADEIYNPDNGLYHFSFDTAPIEENTLSNIKAKLVKKGFKVEKVYISIHDKDAEGLQHVVTIRLYFHD